MCSDAVKVAATVPTFLTPVAGLQVHLQFCHTHVALGQLLVRHCDFAGPSTRTTSVQQVTHVLIATDVTEV